jgi:hypothetical protein
MFSNTYPAHTEQCRCQGLLRSGHWNALEVTPGTRHWPLSSHAPDLRLRALSAIASAHSHTSFSVKRVGMRSTVYRFQVCSSSQASRSSSERTDGDYNIHWNEYRSNRQLITSACNTVCSTGSIPPSCLRCGVVHFCWRGHRLNVLTRQVRGCRRSMACSVKNCVSSCSCHRKR